MAKKRVYIAGPMRGIKDFNFPAFDDARNRAGAAGFHPISPADLDREAGVNEHSEFGEEALRLTIKRDYEALMTCDAIAMLPGWQNSKGAKFEKALAEMLHLEVLDAMDWTPLRTSFAQVDIVEVRVTDPETGGMKGTKMIRPALIPADILWEDAKVYGLGAEKYDDENWRKGYAWSLSLDALERHLLLWQLGESYDAEGFHHLAAVRWHCATLMTFEREHPEKDDRPYKPLEVK